MEKVINIIEDSIEIKKSILDDKELLSQIIFAAEIITEALSKGNKVMLCGNGGSAADAQHVAAEFSGKFLKNRRALPALCLNSNVSALTAISNDFGYENSFLRQVQAFGQCGDVLIGFSISGNSRNVIEAFKYASSTDIKTIAFTGQNPNAMGEFSDIVINIPSVHTPRIQEAHILLAHILCELVENKMF